MEKLVLSKLSLAELREIIHLQEERVAPYPWTQVESIPLSNHELRRIQDIQSGDHKLSRNGRSGK